MIDRILISLLKLVADAIEKRKTDGFSFYVIQDDDVVVVCSRESKDDLLVAVEHFAEVGGIPTVNLAVHNGTILFIPEE